MLGEKVIRLLSPKDHKEDWFVLETDENLYNLRLGGYERILGGRVHLRNYEIVDIPFEGMMINRHLTDEESVYIFIGNNFVLESGWMDISLSGEQFLGTSIGKVEDYEQDYFDTSEMFDMIIGKNQFSKIVQ